jgi:hypothetical protein
MTYHVDDGHGRARCGEPCAGMFLVEREARATCAACVDPLLVRIPNTIEMHKEATTPPVTQPELFDKMLYAAKRYSAHTGKDVVLMIDAKSSHAFQAGKYVKTITTKRSKRNGTH